MKMKNPIKILLCALLLVACSEAESVPEDLAELSGKVAERTHFPKYTSQIDSHLALAMLRHDYDDHSLRIAHATVVTHIHALTPVTSINEFLPDRYENLYLYVGILYSDDHDHVIHHIEPHPRANQTQQYPYADIAVIFLKEAINFDQENADFARLRVADLDEEHLVQEIKLDDDHIFLDPVFYVINVANTGWIGISNPPMSKTIFDTGAPIFSNQRLVGIAPCLSGPDNRLIFTKIHNVSPFVIDQLKKDTVEDRNPKYNHNWWLDEECFPDFVNNPSGTVL